MNSTLLQLSTVSVAEGGRHIIISAINDFVSLSQCMLTNTFTPMISLVSLSSFFQSSIRKNGNFIKYDKATNRWFEIGDELAREKVGQKLREAIFSREALGNTTNQRPSASSNFYEDALQLAKLDCQIVAHSLFGNGASSPESGTGSTWNSNKINVFQPIEQMESNLNIGLEFEMTRTSNNFEGMSKLARLSCTGNMIGGIPCEPQCDDEADSFDELVSELFLEGSSMEYIPIEPLDPNDEIPIEMSSMLSSFLP